MNSEADHETSENRGRNSGMKGTANSSYLSYIVEKDRPRQAVMGKTETPLEYFGPMPIDHAEDPIAKICLPPFRATERWSCFASRCSRSRPVDCCLCYIQNAQKNINSAQF